MKLVLLPGMDGTGELFKPFVDEFDTYFDPVVVEYPVSEPLGYDQLEHVARSYLPTDEPYVLLGESFSGPIAISLAASAPKGLAALVLCCTFARNPHPTLTAFRALVSRVPVHRVPSVVTSFILLGSDSNETRRASLSAALNRVAPSVIQARLREVLSVDKTENLARITVPTLCLRALNDRVVPVTAAEYLVENLSVATIEDFESPHFLLQVWPKDVAASLKHFVECNVHVL